jgi:hypothetical protein
MHMKPEAMSPDHWLDFKNAVHRALTEIEAEIRDPQHPRQEVAKGDGIAIVPDAGSPELAADEAAKKSLQTQLDALKKQVNDLAAAKPAA